jgi:hypothetical protein
MGPDNTCGTGPDTGIQRQERIISQTCSIRDEIIKEDKKLDNLVDCNNYLNMSVSVPEEGTAVGEEDGAMCHIRK